VLELVPWWDLGGGARGDLAGPGLYSGNGNAVGGGGAIYLMSE
jgi:hypothetical protein